MMLSRVCQVRNRNRAFYNCHSREGGNPDYCKASKLLTLKELPFKFSVSIHKTGIWIPTFAGMTTLSRE